MTSANASNSPQMINVTLVVSAATPPVLREVQNAARNEQSLLAPGMILRLKGTNLGPATGVSGKVTNGVVDTTLSDVRVLFDGVPAPILYARQDQINTVAPYFLFGRTLDSGPDRVSRTAIRRYRISRCGCEPRPVYHGCDRPRAWLDFEPEQHRERCDKSRATRRSDRLYATGEGQVTPAGTDGRIVSGAVGTLPRPVLPVASR